MRPPSSFETLALMVTRPPSPFETRCFATLLRVRAGLEPRSLLRMRADARQYVEAA
jgi:hypothetical protein